MLNIDKEMDEIMYHRSCREWFIHMGVFCIVAGIIVGFILLGYGPTDPLLIISIFFLNTFSVFGYIFLSIGLILQYFKIRLHKHEQKLKPQTQKFSSLKDFVEDKVNQEDK